VDLFQPDGVRRSLNKNVSKLRAGTTSQFLSLSLCVDLVSPDCQITLANKAYLSDNVGSRYLTTDDPQNSALFPKTEQEPLRYLTDNSHVL
jgi:hypothetical protein